MPSAQRITKDMTIAEAIRLCPEAAGVFDRHGMGCFVCLGATAETIEEGALMHGLDAQVIVDELNSCLDVEKTGTQSEQ